MVSFAIGVGRYCTCIDDIHNRVVVSPMVGCEHWIQCRSSVKPAMDN